jgi:hypothetical protein
MSCDLIMIIEGRILCVSVSHLYPTRKALLGPYWQGFVDLIFTFAIEANVSPTGLVVRSDLVSAIDVGLL